MEHTRPVGSVLLLLPGKLQAYQESPVLVLKSIYASPPVTVSMKFNQALLKQSAKINEEVSLKTKMNALERFMSNVT